MFGVFSVAVLQNGEETNRAGHDEAPLSARGLARRARQLPTNRTKNCERSSADVTKGFWD